ncbi:MAG: envelope stress response membrane protein PspC [Desulfotignum sp.]|nr:envelope stress response membrane protein PspC [Desulfotignum sp.]MCF8126493.1 envelope stress response membrane protein PspC [Desulfotignum sp.]
MRYHYKRKHQSGYTRCKNHYTRFRDRFADITNDRRIYRSRKGIIMGVCRGVAEHFNLSVFWVRMIFLLIFLFTGFWPVGVLYIIAGLILKPEPVVPFQNENDQEFYQSYTTSRESAIQRLKRKFDNIDQRIRRMEHTVTSRDFDL